MIHQKNSHQDQFVLDNMPTDNLPELSKKFSNIENRFNFAEKLLVDNLRQYANQTCIYYGDEKYCYQDIENLSNRIANFLTTDLGFITGERVLLQGANSPMLVALWFAVLKAGGICVTVMPLLRASELNYIIENSNINYAFCDQICDQELKIAAKDHANLKCIASFSDNNEGSAWLDKKIIEKSTIFKAIKTYATDPAIIAYTSGTTGKAKGTVHTHADLFAIGKLFPKQILQLSPNDICGGSPSIAFTFGLGALLIFPMSYGASIVFIKHNKPEALLEAIGKFKISIFYSVPTMYQRLLKILQKTNLNCVRKYISAGEHLPLHVAQSWLDVTGKKIINSIGSTEMLHIFLATDDTSASKLGSLGKPINGYDAKILNDQDQEVPTGTYGVLAVKGETGCRYLNNLNAQDKYVKNGWNFTGDICMKDEDGVFWYHTRQDDLIISSGYNISGIEVENVLLTHPQVKECAVVGIPDSERGQIVKAFLVLNEKSSDLEKLNAEIKSYVKAKISPYKYPRCITFVQAIERNANGKIQRHTLRGSAA